MMKNVRKAIWATLALLTVTTVAFAETQLSFTPPIELSNQTPDLGLAFKSKLVRLANGILVVTYGDAVEDVASKYVYDVKNDADRPARDVFVRTCDSAATDSDCSIETNWSEPVNISNTATQASIETDWDGDTDGSNARKPAYGDSDKPNIFSAGKHVAVTWGDKYCPGEDQGTDRRTTDERTTDQLTTDQRTVTYLERDNREVPFSCLYESHSANNGATWSTAQQLTTGERDVKQDVNKGTSSGRWTITWQEDPLGLALGGGDGPGDGASGAQTSHGTDVWYTYSTGLTTPADIGAWSTPGRLTDNATADASGNHDVIRNANGREVTDREIEGGIAGASRPNLALVGSTVISAYEETKGSGGLAEGKFIRYYDFTFNDVAGTNNPSGCIISNPAENARRVRFVTQGTPGPDSGLRWAIFWKEGEFDQGGPSDIMLRLGSRDFTSANLSPGVDLGCETSDYATAIALNNLAALNLSHETPSGGDLTVASGTNNFEDARAHRALLRGDDLYVGFSYTPDWAVARFTDTENYNFWLRHYDGTTDNWTSAVNLSDIDDKGINVKEPRLVGTPGSSGPGCPTGDPADPATTNTEDCKDSDVYYVAWGTQTNVYEHVGGAVDLDLFITRTTDKGQTYEPVVTMAGGPNAQFESQIRPTPAGGILYAMWNESGSTNAMFSIGTPVALPTSPPVTDPEPEPVPEPETESSSGGGGGGCAVNPRTSFDPVLPALLLAGIAALGFRRRRSGQYS